MSLPTRLAYSVRPGAQFGLLAAAASVTVMFVSTPFLVPELASHFDVTEGMAGGVSVAQVGAFAAINLFLPRFVRPSGRLLTIAAAGLVTANLLSAFAPSFPVLLIIRVFAGAGAGTLTWIAWTDAMRQPRSLSALAKVGPVTALVAAPVLSLVAELGDRAVFLVLAAVAAPILLLRVETGAGSSTTRKVSKSRSNLVLLGTLFVHVLVGSALFIYSAVAARDELGLSPVLASFGFSLNALGGLIGAQFSNRHRRPGLWLASTGPAAFLVIAGGHEIWFFAGLFWWGLSFWMGIPGVIQMLADRSIEPGERAGDAQGVMAVGRAIGPAVGGAFTDAGAFTGLALITGIGMTAAGLTITGVQEGRELLPPSDPNFSSNPSGSSR